MIQSLSHAISALDGTSFPFSIAALRYMCGVSSLGS